MSSRKFKSKDLVLQSGKFTFGDVVQDGDMTTADVTLVARTDSPVKTFMGDFVHDLRGMFSKEKVNLDWRHDSDESIGYLNQFDVTDKQITCHGKLVSVESGDRASKIMKQAHAGIPFESSIFFGGEGIEIEEVSTNKKASVNGREYSGPCVVFRKWPMRGVALCPYGKDNQTSANFNFEDGDVEYSASVLEKGESDMSNDKKEVIDAPKVKEIVKMEDKTPEKKTEDKVKSTIPMSSDGLSGKDFIGAFGDEGAVWFAEGKSYAEATVMYIKKLEKTVEDLTARLSNVKTDMGGEALDSDDGDVDKKKVAFDKKVADLTDKIGPNLAKFAASLNLGN